MKGLVIAGAASVSLIAGGIVIYLNGGKGGMFDLRRVRVRSGSGRDA